ncbi:hypothetical protein [Streptomyces hokutonensis]|uniref:hypothetical protein n=1 Tax=Streptomyces hokutonensis TaxID=1306990 RepID=UPI003804A1DE
MTAQPEQRQQHTPRAGESSTLEAVRLRLVNRWPAQGLGGEPGDLYVDSRERSAAAAHSRFDGALPQSIEQLTASGGVFAITDILVRPQDQGVGRRLQERLLSDHQATLGATLVDPGEVWRPAGPTMFRALAFPVGERTTARLEGLAHDAWSRWPT